MSGEYLVAAADASVRVKALADVTCAGGDDVGDINDAIAAVAAEGGGIVRMTAGHFCVNDADDASIVMAAGVSLRGSGQHCTVIYGRPNANVTGPAWVADTVYAAGAIVTNDTGKLYICVTGGTSAGAGGPTGTGTAIADNTCSWDYMTPQDQSIVEVFGADSGVISDLTLDKREAADDPEPAASAQGQLLRVAGSGTNAGPYLTVERVTFRNCSRDAINYLGVAASPGRHLYVHDCEVHDVRRGLQAGGTATTADYSAAIMAGCRIHDCDEDGALVSAIDSIALGNRVWDCGGNGISSSRVAGGLRLIANVVRGCSAEGQSGINVTAYTNDYVVAANVCIGNALNLSSDVNVDDNWEDSHGVIVGNVCAGATEHHGINLNWGQGTAVVGNACHGNALSGVGINQRDSVVVGNATVDNGRWGVQTSNEDPDAGGNVLVLNVSHGCGYGEIKNEQSATATRPNACHCATSERAILVDTL